VVGGRADETSRISPEHGFVRSSEHHDDPRPAIVPHKRLGQREREPVAQLDAGADPTRAGTDDCATHDDATDHPSDDATDRPTDDDHNSSERGRRQLLTTTRWRDGRAVSFFLVLANLVLTDHEPNLG
jgi:hypothetical protein